MVDLWWNTVKKVIKLKCKVPLGIEDYVIAQNYYYVDKTMLIDDVINNNIGNWTSHD